MKNSESHKYLFLRVGTFLNMAVDNIDLFTVHMKNSEFSKKKNGLWSFKIFAQVYLLDKTGKSKTRKPRKPRKPRKLPSEFFVSEFSSEL